MSMSARLQESQQLAQKDITILMNERSIVMKKYENMKQENEILAEKMRFFVIIFCFKIRFL